MRRAYTRVAMTVLVATAAGGGLIYLLTEPARQNFEGLWLPAAGVISAALIAAGVLVIPSARRARRLQQRLDTIQLEREELMQAVAHEIGTPLSRMRVRLELLSDELGDAAGGRLGAMLDDLAEIDDLSTELVAWVEADAGLVHTEWLDAGLTARDLLERSIEPPITWEIQGDEDERIVDVDPRQFRRAIQNLVRNAGRYARSKVVVSTVDAGDQVVVDVRDDGPGIPVADRERVLKPFTRVDKSRTRDGGGLGLGLAIVHRIVTRHGGTVDVGVAPEGGALLSTSWPKAGDELVPPPG